MVYLPKFKKVIKEKAFPFDWEHLLALAAPSPTMVITGLNDEVFSNTRSCEKAVKLARNVYKLLGASGAIENYVHNDGHRMTLEGLEVCDEWIERWL